MKVLTMRRTTAIVDNKQKLFTDDTILYKRSLCLVMKKKTYINQGDGGILSFYNSMLGCCSVKPSQGKGGREKRRRRRRRGIGERERER